MQFGVAFEPRDWLLTIQLCFMVVFGLASWVVVWFIARQLRTQSQALNLSTMATRHKMFISLTDCVTEEMQETMLLHAIDHFEPDIFVQKYRGKTRYIKSYLLMKRKYLYLVFSSRLERYFPIFDGGIAVRWIPELCQYHEFRDVHASQKHYYPAFATLVDPSLTTAELKGWMCEALPLDSITTPSVPASQESALSEPAPTTAA